MATAVPRIANRHNSRTIQPNTRPKNRVTTFPRRPRLRVARGFAFRLVAFLALAGFGAGFFGARFSATRAGRFFLPVPLINEFQCLLVVFFLTIALGAEIVRLQGPRHHISFMLKK